jgi:hypothetical protein
MHGVGTQQSWWINVFPAYCQSAKPLTALDLGCGGGRFIPALADALWGPAYWGGSVSSVARQGQEGRFS